MQEWDTNEYAEGPSEKPPEPPGSSFFGLAVGGLVVLLLFILASASSQTTTIEVVTATAVPEAVDPPLPPSYRTDTPPPMTQPPPPLASSPGITSLADKVAQLRPSCLYVWFDRPDARFSGTGFVVDLNGHVVTNAHVVQDYDYPALMSHLGRTYRGRVVARDTANDLALIEAKLPHSLPPVTLSNSSDARIGDDILVFGFPVGLFSEITVTPGIISSIRHEENRFQLSASVNPGNSGGPVFDRSSGNVVAVVVSRHSKAEAISFAIPSNVLRGFLERSLP